MGSTVVEVVKVVAPIALQALAKAAMSLVEGGAAARVVSYTDLSPVECGNVIDSDTRQYVSDQFQNNFRYFYKGMGSTPPGASMPLIAATEDIIVWNPAKNELSDIQNYMTNVLKDSLSDGDAIEVAQNLSSLFQDRFSEVDLGWSQFIKRFNLSGSGVTIDVQMVTASGYDIHGKVEGIATYCFVAYKTSN